MDADGRPRGPLTVGTSPTLLAEDDRGDAPTAMTTRSAESASTEDPFTLVSGEVPDAAVELLGAELPAGERFSSGPVLGKGGMGEVRLVHDTYIGRRVAEKALHAAQDTPRARARFLREARVQAQLEHPAIVPVYDLASDAAGRPVFRMKRVRGETLERILEHQRRGDATYLERHGTRRLLAAMVQVCRAVDYAHARGVLHRDLKPGNVMLGDFGEVYVLDWGLARITGNARQAEDDAEPDSGNSAVSDSVARGLTARGAILGTLAYMAPEQLVGDGADVDGRADVFAIGTILWEILTLRRLRGDAPRFEEVVMSTLAKLPRAREVNPEIAPELDELLARCLARAREERPASAREVAEALERYLDGDRDLELRRGLARAHLARARELLGTGPPGERRVQALAEVFRALAFDATSEDGKALLAGLLVESRDVPEGARAAVEQERHAARARGARLGAWALASWLLVVPLVAWMGVKSWWVIGAGAAATAIASLTAFRIARDPRPRRLDAAVALGGTALTITLTTGFFGPFALVPTTAVSAMMLIAMHALPGERRAALWVMGLAAGLPFLGELLELPFASYTFLADRVVVQPRVAELPALPTLLVMLYSTLSFVVLAGLFIGRFRDELDARLERERVQSWMLGQVFPRR